MKRTPEAIDQRLTSKEPFGVFLPKRLQSSIGVLAERLFGLMLPYRLGSVGAFIHRPGFSPPLIFMPDEHCLGGCVGELFGRAKQGDNSLAHHLAAKRLLAFRTRHQNTRRLAGIKPSQHSRLTEIVMRQRCRPSVCTRPRPIPDTGCRPRLRARCAFRPGCSPALGGVKPVVDRRGCHGGAGGCSGRARPAAGGAGWTKSGKARRRPSPRAWS